MCMLCALHVLWSTRVPTERGPLLTRPDQHTAGALHATASSAARGTGACASRAIGKVGAHVSFPCRTPCPVPCLHRRRPRLLPRLPTTPSWTCQHCRPQRRARLPGGWRVQAGRQGERMQLVFRQERQVQGMRIRLHTSWQYLRRRLMARATAAWNAAPAPPSPNPPPTTPRAWLQRPGQKCPAPAWLHSPFLDDSLICITILIPRFGTAGLIQSCYTTRESV